MQVYIEGDAAATVPAMAGAHTEVVRYRGAAEARLRVPQGPPHVVQEGRPRHGACVRCRAALLHAWTLAMCRALGKILFSGSAVAPVAGSQYDQSRVDLVQGSAALKAVCLWRRRMQ